MSIWKKNVYKNGNSHVKYLGFSNFKRFNCCFFFYFSNNIYYKKLKYASNKCQNIIYTRYNFQNAYLNHILQLYSLFINFFINFDTFG